MAQPRETREYGLMMRRMLRSYVARVGSNGDVADLQDLAQFVTDTEQALRESVHRQRERGASWADIGKALGLTRQAAHKRFGDPERPGLRSTGGQPSHLR